MWKFALIPFMLQAITIGIDEVYFHYKRGLPRWEKIGHPLDTLSLLICLLIPLFFPFNDYMLKVYIGLAIISCLMVTKDEFIHKEHSSGAENWLHAILFILHPIVLTVAAMIWPVIQNEVVPLWLGIWLNEPDALRWFLQIQVGSICLFLFYQIIFWNWICKNQTVIKL